MKKMNNLESKRNLENMLKEFDEFCRFNSIKYSLIGGTLIGAIRHKGFIPWDDDIDVILSKDDYNKLLDLLKKTNYSLKNRFAFFNNDNNKSYYYPYMKMVDLHTITEEKKFKHINDYGQFIDIFYYSKAPKSALLKKIFYFEILAGRILISGYSTKCLKIKDKLFFVKLFGKIITFFIGIKNVIKIYNRNLSKYDNLDSNYYVACWPIYGYNKEIQFIPNIDKYINCKFENVNSMCFEAYDSILSLTYGDYMKLPPMEKRINHGIEVYWKNK